MYTSPSQDQDTKQAFFDLIQIFLILTQSFDHILWDKNLKVKSPEFGLGSIKVTVGGSFYGTVAVINQCFWHRGKVMKRKRAVCKCYDGGTTF